MKLSYRWFVVTGGARTICVGIAQPA